MALVNLSEARLFFGDVALLDQVNFSLGTGERVGLVGRNGAGKSSLLRVLARLGTLDDGTLQWQTGLTASFVPQEPELDHAQTVFDCVALPLAPVRQLTEAYSSGHGDLVALQNAIDLADGWAWQQRVDELLHRLKLSPDDVIGTLSGGTRKRVALAMALVTRPDVLFLDEPTNHLDLDSIHWLEELLLAFRGSVVLVSHDRAFLDAVSTRIVELDRGSLRSYPGNFAAYLARKSKELEDELTARARADTLLKQEEAWIRKGVEARRTRSVSRVARLEALRQQRRSRREVVGRVSLAVDPGGAQGYQGKVVAELRDVGLKLGDRVITSHLSVTFLRGDKVGLIGPNGCGKTSLLKLVLGEFEASSGDVKRARNLNVAYFDQMREALDPDATLENFISPGSEWVEINGRQRHVRSYLGDFLFNPSRATSPVRSLSGGERNRLLLARLFARPANVLVLDEPTNDLDIDTLELLEQMLHEYPGTVFLVSHDRRFVDGVVTSTLVFQGNGQWCEYDGGIEDWLTQASRSPNVGTTRARPPERVGAPAAPADAHAPTDTAVRRKLSYKEQRELDALPQQIEALEREQNGIRGELSDATIYARDPRRAAELHTRDAAIEEELSTALERWEELAARA